MDGVARLRECARGLDPDTVLAAARATDPETIDPTAKLTLRRVAAVLSERGGPAYRTLLGCAGGGYLAGTVVLDGGSVAGGTAAPDPARVRRLLSRVREYDLDALDAALGPLAELHDATARTAFRLGLGLAVAEDELRRGAGDD